MKKIQVILLMSVLMLLSTVSVSVATSNAVSLSLVNQNPYPATAGSIVEVRIGVENFGDTLKNVEFEVDEQYPFSIVGDTTQTISSLNSYQEGDDKEILTYELRIADDARAGEYDLDIMYSDPASNSITKTTLTIEVSSDDTAEIIHIDKTVLIPGKETEMTFKIVNNGGSSLHDLTFSFENPDDAILPVGSDNTRHVSFIGAGESQEITYTVVADTTVDPGLYVLDLNLEYEDDYSSSNIQTTTAGVYVGGETSFSVALSETTTNEITLSVANIGSNPAYSVLVSLPSQQGLSVSGASSQIIGNLDNGDYTLASFSVSNNPENLEVIVSYTDTRGERIEVTQDISLGTSQSETATGDSNMPPATADGTTRTAGNRNPMMQMTNPQSNNSGISSLLINTFIVVIIVVGGIVGYRYYKKRKSNKLRPLKRAKR